MVVMLLLLLQGVPSWQAASMYGAQVAICSWQSTPCAHAGQGAIPETIGIAPATTEIWQARQLGSQCGIGEPIIEDATNPAIQLQAAEVLALLLGPKAIQRWPIVGQPLLQLPAITVAQSCKAAKVGWQEAAGAMKPAICVLAAVSEAI